MSGLGLVLRLKQSLLIQQELLQLFVH